MPVAMISISAFAWWDRAYQMHDSRSWRNYGSANGLHVEAVSRRSSLQGVSAQDEPARMTEESSTQITPVSDVFVSYASQDVAVANNIVEALETHGIMCWIAPRDVRPGTVYADAIVGAINEAKALVLVLSANAMPSAHVGREVERAASKRKQVIAFRVDATPLSRALEYFLSDSQWIDVPKLGMPAALRALTAAVRQGPATAPQPVSVGRSAGGSKRNVVIVAAVVGVGVAVAVGMHFWSINHSGASDYRGRSVEWGTS